MYLNKFVSDLYAERKGYKTNHAIEEDSNLAVSLRRSGLYLGIAIAMMGIIIGPSAGFYHDVTTTIVYGAVISALFFVARQVNDLFVLHGVSNTKEIFEKDNMAIGFVEAGGFISTGIIAMASMMGTGGNIATFCAFFVFGQLLLLLASHGYEKLTKWRVVEEIRKGNTSAGINLAGIMVALSVAISGALSRDFDGWLNSLLFVSIESAMGLAAVLAVSFLADRFYLPSTDIETEVVRDKNIAAVSLVACLQIAGAFIISASIT